MTTTSELIYRLTRLVQSKNATTFFLNGPPGSGKSYLLQQLAARLPSEIPRSLVLGPYSVTSSSIKGLGDQVVRDCREAGFLDGVPPSGLDLVRAWQWLGENAHMPPGQAFLVLFDLSETSQFDLAAQAGLFSTVRYLEGLWNRGNVRILHLCGGQWDPIALEHHFTNTHTSFPYTVGHNYMIWNGLCREEMIALVEQARPGEATPLHGRILFELTDGHPGAALEILKQTALGKLGFSTLLSSTQQAAVNGRVGRALVDAWCRLPVGCKSIVRDLSLRRRMQASILPSHLTRLCAFGLARVDQIAGVNYLGFRSWYVELLTRFHAEELSIADEQTQRIEIDQLMPQAGTLNVEAYHLINDIENQARNFITVHLCRQKSPGQPTLADKSWKHNSYKDAYEDAHQRARDWRMRSSDRGLPTELNPLIAYLSTRDLADLIAEVSAEIKSEAWQRIAQAIQDLSGVRDAVMHNQLIDDACLQRLYDLQAAVYEALGEAG